MFNELLTDGEAVDYLCEKLDSLANKVLRWPDMLSMIRFGVLF
jgi:hypothetical protein